MWDLEILMGIGFQMGQILWDFISVWDMSCMEQHMPEPKLEWAKSPLVSVSLWIRMIQQMSHVMRKPVCHMPTKRIQIRLCILTNWSVSLLFAAYTGICYIQNSKTLAKFYSWAGWFASYLSTVFHNMANGGSNVLSLFSCIWHCNITKHSPFEPRHDKTNKMSVRPVKTQSLRCALNG